MSYDLTCVITGHNEGHISIPSLRAFEAAIVEAETSGLSVQPLYYLDNPNDLTRMLFKAHARSASMVCEVSFADQGRVRNHAVDVAEGKYIAFLDGDDLWDRRWLVDAVAFLSEQEEQIIAHPAYNYFFEGNASIFCHHDQEETTFNLDLLRVTNYWDALCVCETAIYRRFPFTDRAIDAGWAYEDWYWNCETLAVGIRHKVVPDTIIFKRRQRMSQTIRASTNRSMIRANGLSRYANNLYWKENVTQ